MRRSENQKAIRWWKTNLHILGYFVGDPERSHPPTRPALTDFQEEAGLPVTGKRDKATHRSVCEMLAWLKGCLHGLGYYPDDDGDLKKAIYDYQQHEGLVQDGVAGPRTRAALYRQVRWLQQKLLMLNCFESQEAEKIPYGTFDPLTAKALTRFQDTGGQPSSSPRGILDGKTREALHRKPPFTFADQLCEELAAVDNGRHEIRQIDNEPNAGCDHRHPVSRAHGKRLAGLAFSGGGIRSATFNLGLIQALAEMRLIHCFDYLSTVSGGGYIGSWLSAWIHRHEKGVLGVEAQLVAVCEETGHEPHEVAWLRRFSNYLTPRIGVLSLDTLTMVATWLRNVLLNQAILLLMLGFALLVPWVMLALCLWLQSYHPGSPLFLAIAGGIPLLISTGLSAFESALTARGCRIDTNWRNRIPWVIAIANMIAAIVLAFLLPLYENKNTSEFFWLMVGFALVVPWMIGWLLGAFRSGGDSYRARLAMVDHLGAISAACAASLLLSALLWGYAAISTPADHVGHVVLGVPAVLALVLLATVLHVGLAGRRFREAVREWWSREGAIQIKVGLFWLMLMSLALYGPYLVYLMQDWLVHVGIFWAVSTAAGVLAGRSAATTGLPGGKRWVEIVAIGAPYIFGAGLLLVVAYGLQGALTGHVCSPPEQAPSEHPAYVIRQQVSRPEGGTVYRVNTLTHTFDCRFSDYQLLLQGKTKQVITGDQQYWYLIAFLLMLALFSILGWRVDINIFSSHMFYRNRLERCYLGASNRRRQPHRFTGLDPNDSPKLTGLLCQAREPEAEQTGTEKASRSAHHKKRPLHIINTTLNLTRSNELAWQERKAASFTFTPLFCGYQFMDTSGQSYGGYQRTLSYCKEKRWFNPNAWITLGNPVTISGAAASPNWGYHTSAATAFLMTLFNVRIGWWTQNTALTEVWEKTGPLFSIRYLLKELTGSTDQNSKFLYLSDGGHFENLGIYELVRRRCRFIVASDATQDLHYAFEELGNAIRKCRVDLGIDIDIDTRALMPDSDSHFSHCHCAVGSIHYEGVDPEGQTGYLVYIKASLTGKEPGDVLQYRAANPAFPHQSTMDQWYDESQFESYRQLGYSIGKAVFEPALFDARPSPGSECDFEDLVAELRKRWYPPSRVIQASFSRYGEELEKLFERIRTDERLAFMDAQIYPEWRSLIAGTLNPPAVNMWLPETHDQARAGFYLSNSLIQFIENVFLDLDLEREWEHPDNRGWMNLFQNWAWSGMFRLTWAICANTYGARFQKFCERRLGLSLGEVSAKSYKFQNLHAPDAETPDFEIYPVNFVEWNQIQAIIRQCLEGESSNLYVVRFRLHLKDVFAIREGVTASKDDRAKDADVFSFTFGFALLRDTGSRDVVLLYFRIRDHLRNMGLGRLALRKLLETCSPKRVTLVDCETLRRLERASQEFSPEFKWTELERLFTSVQGKGGASPGASWSGRTRT